MRLSHLFKNIPKRRHFIALFVGLAVAIGAFAPVSYSVLAPLTGVTEASAQAKKKKRRSLFSILFGKRKAKKTVKKRRTKRKVSKKSRRKNARRSNVAAASAPKKVEKVENAKVVLVIGDFFAGSLAKGLEKALEDSAVIKVVSKSNGNSGFVRSDVVNWPVRVGELAEELKPSHIIAMLGTNDRQLLREDGKKLKKRTPEWDAAYQKRLAAFAASLKATGVPYTWMGLPPVRFNSMSTDFLFFNEWYHKAAVDGGGKFIDVWDGFADAQGAYSRSGPDINGQITLLRGKDGINLTRAGRRRLAFYVEATIRKQLGDGAGLIASVDEGLGSLAVSQPTAPSYDPAKSGKTVVINLDDPTVDGSTALAGAQATQPASIVVPVATTVRPASNRGRADNFSWPPTGTSQINPQGAVAATN